jgi:integrase
VALKHPNDDSLARLDARSRSLDTAREAELQETAEGAAEFLRASRATSTRSAYASDWKQFTEWIESHGLDPLPADPRMIALWISHMARSLKRKPASIRRMLTAIGTIHRSAGHPNPCDQEIVREEMRGIANTLGVRPKRAAPLLIPHLEAIVENMGEGLRSVRDRAIVLVGWSGAMRRSEIAALRAEDLTFLDKGVSVLIRRSKTDQQGKGEHVALFYATRTALCPVRAIQAWMRDAPIVEGPLFVRLSSHRSAPQIIADPLSPEMIRYIVQTWTSRAGVQPEQIGAVFSAHSLRAGFITEAARNGRAEWTIAKQSRHKSADVLRSYIRVADTFEGNAGEGLL